MCPFNKARSQEHCFDGQNIKWKKGVNWMNCPFSKGIEWVIQSAIQFYDGLDVVMLVEYDTLKNRIIY